MRLFELVLLITSCRAIQTAYHDAAAAHQNPAYQHSGHYPQHQAASHQHQQDNHLKKFSPIIVENSQLSTQYLPPQLEYIEPLGPAANKRMDETPTFNKDVPRVKQGHAEPTAFSQHKPKALNSRSSNSDVVIGENTIQPREDSPRFSNIKMNWMIEQAFNGQNKGNIPYVPQQNSHHVVPYYGPQTEAIRRSNGQQAQQPGTPNADPIKAAATSSQGQSFNNQYIPASAYYGPVTEAIPILKQMTEMDIDGSYSFETLTADQTHFAQQGHVENLGTDHAENVVQGSYSYVGDDGQTYTVNYVADGNGFRATGDHLPTPPPIPDIIQRYQSNTDATILESIQYNIQEEASRPAGSSYDSDDNINYISKYQQLGVQPANRNNGFYIARPQSETYAPIYQSQQSGQKTHILPRPQYPTPTPVHEDITQSKGKDDVLSPRNSHFSAPHAYLNAQYAAGSSSVVKSYPPPLSTAVQTNSFSTLQSNQDNELEQSKNVISKGETQAISPRIYNPASFSVPSPNPVFQPPKQTVNRSWQPFQNTYVSQPQSFQPITPKKETYVPKTEEPKVTQPTAQQRYDSEPETNIYEYVPKQNNEKYYPKYYLGDNNQPTVNFYQQFEEGYGRKIYPQTQNQVRNIPVSSPEPLQLRLHNQQQQKQQLRQQQIEQQKQHFQQQQQQELLQRQQQQQQQHQQQQQEQNQQTFSRASLQPYSLPEQTYRQFYHLKNDSTPKGFSRKQNDNEGQSQQQQTQKSNLPSLGRAGPTAKAYIPPQIPKDQ